MLTLFDLPHSPFCLPIKRILEALKVPFTVEDVPNWDRRKVIEASGGAYYGVPMLMDGGRAIYETGGDSQDIASYVDQNFAGGKLFPKELEGLHDIILRYLENEVEDATFRAADAHYVPSISDPIGRVMTLRHKERKFGRGCVDQWKERLPELRAGAAEHFARFDAMLRHKPYLLAERPVYADFLLWGIVGNFTWKGWNEIPASLSGLQEWRKRMDAFVF